MKSLLKVSAAVMVLAVMAAAMVLFFGSMDRSRGQLPAAAPTPVPPLTPQATLPLLTNPVITPDISSTPRPVPSVIIDPIWIAPKPDPDTTPGPTSPPLPATGGPYVREAEAIEKALAFTRRPGNQLNERVAPRAIFTAAKNINSILGDPRPASLSEREKWIVIFEGRFTSLTGPPAPPPGYRYKSPVMGKMYVIIDATTGDWSSVRLREELEPGGVVKE